MSRSVYSRLAAQGIKKNRRLYLPYLIASSGMVAMFYIITAIVYSPALNDMGGGGTAAQILSLGKWVVAAFSILFLLYTNSFLVRSRKHEFGLYSVLGMGKKHISRIVLIEALISAAIQLVCGLGAGILLSKLAEMGLISMIRGSVTFEFSLPIPAVITTVIFYAAVSVIITVKTLIQIRRSNPLELIRSESAGEKPPRGNLFIAIPGILLLGGAYWIAVSIENPIDALLWFFIAVIMVIIGTYFVFTAASVAFCRMLRKNRKYYYKPNHFVSISSLAYRMKRNGAGLASICILGTVVLVMLTSTSSLFFGEDDSLYRRYPREINCEARLRTIEQYGDENLDKIHEGIVKAAGEYGSEVKNGRIVRFGSVAGAISERSVICDMSMIDSAVSYSSVRQMFFVSDGDYASAGGAYDPGGDGILLLTSGCSYEYGDITVDGRTFPIDGVYVSDVSLAEDFSQVTPTFVLVVPDMEEAISMFRADDGSYKHIDLVWRFGFDTGLSGDEQLELRDNLYLQFDFGDGEGYEMYSVTAREAERGDFFGTYGGLFFLGIVLSIVFIFAAVLIIYYKQISEGYEDQSRFEIMQKVGMTKKDIRRSINSQMLTVFLMPLIAAGVHLAFAFPMVNKLLQLFGLFNTRLFITVNIFCYLIFAVFYGLVYKLTSNAYYSIVVDAKAE